MEQRVVRAGKLQRYAHKTARIAAYVVVFGWSLLFLSLAYCLAAPLLFMHAIADRAEAELASDFFVALGASVIVASSALLLLRRSVRSSPRKILAFFYGFEAPMVMLIAVRLFFIRELTVGAAFTLGCIVLGCVSMAWSVFRPYATARSAAHAQLFVTSASVVAALSLGAYFSLYLPSVLTALADTLSSASFWRHLWQQLVWSRGFSLLWSLTGVAFLLASGSLFIAAPLGVIVAHVLQFRDQLRFHRLRFQRPALTAAIALFAIVASVSVWGVTSRRDTRATLERLDAALQAPTPAALQAIYRDEAAVKTALLDGYLAPYRYLGSTERTDHLREMARGTWIAGPFADALQGAHNVIARPFLYDGASLTADQTRADTIYATLFDAPIQRSERAAIDHAFASTYERLLQKAASSVVDIDAERVRLARQDVSVRDAGGAAEVMIHDRYENLTNAPQEVLYNFELSEDAAVTGLWLSSDDDFAHAFAHRIAPRGAAQKVYRAQVRRRVDPALVEQVGPRQYRLRAYPVPAEKPLHVWMRYVARPVDGVVPASA
jgi:putative PEP-CTERM system integral membrane protein